MNIRNFRFSKTHVTIHGFCEFIVFLVFGIFAIFDGIRIYKTIRREGSFDLMGPDGYIIILGIALILFSSIYFVNSFFESQIPDSSIRNSINKSKLIKLFLSFLFYSISIYIVGYPISTYLFLGYLFWVMEVNSLKKIILYSAITSSIFILLFNYLLKMPLPRGFIF